MTIHHFSQMQTQEQPQSLLERIKGYLNHDPDNVKLLGDAADLCLQTGDFVSGKSYVQRALEIAPNSAELLHTLGLLELVSGEISQAHEIFARLVEGGIGHPAVRANLAYTLLLLGKPQAVPELLHDAESCVQDAPEAPALLIRALHTMGDVDQAIEFGERFLEHNPENASIYGLLSTLYIDNEDFDAAGRAAAKAKELGGNIPEAWVTSGTLELAQQKDTLALQHFEQALQENPTSGRAIAGRGLAYMLGRDLKKATEDLKQAVQRMPTHIGTWHALGWSQLLQNDLVAARQTFEHALSMNHNFSESHGAMAIIAIAEGHKVEEASQSIKRALGLDKQCFSGLFAQSLLLNAQGRPELARKIIDGIMNAGVLPGGVTMRQSLVSYLKEQGKKR